MLHNQLLMISNAKYLFQSSHASECSSDGEIQACDLWRNTDNKVREQTACGHAMLTAGCTAPVHGSGPRDAWPRARWSPASSPGCRVREVGPGPPSPSSAAASAQPATVPRPAVELWPRQTGDLGQVTVVLTVELQTNVREDFTITEKAPTRDWKGQVALRIYDNQKLPVPIWPLHLWPNFISIYCWSTHV